MEKKSNGKVIAVFALAIAVLALSVGFAAFSDDLTINGTAKATSNVNPFDDSTNGLAYAGTPECHLTNASSTVINTSPYGPGTATGDTWNGINVPLTPDENADSVTCTATVQNKTSYPAELTSISAGGPVTCSSTGNNASTNSTNICSGVTVEVQVGANAADKITFGAANGATNNSTTGTIAANGSATVTVTISYDKTKAADADVTVTIPTITHHYESVRS